MRIGHTSAKFMACGSRIDGRRGGGAAIALPMTAAPDRAPNSAGGKRLAMLIARASAVFAAAFGSLMLLAPPADAKCTKLAFSVNDYGKEGPANDAKNLLDKYIAKWTADRGIKSYTTGKKDVTCDLFLDFKVFDEYTCKAAATVCWEDKGGSQSASAGTPKAEGSKAAAKASPVATGSVPAPKAKE